MTRGSGCPPPLLLSRSILQHVRNVCQARAGLSHLPIVQQPLSRASTSLAPRGMRTIQDSPCVNHLPVGTSFRIDPGYSASRPPDKYGGRQRPATGPPRWGHASVLRTTAIHHRRARRGRRESRVTDPYSTTLTAKPRTTPDGAKTQASGPSSAPCFLPITLRALR